MVTTAVLVGSLALPAQAASSFNDIHNSFAKEAILTLTNKGIINGIGNDKFNSTGKISRQDFTVILAKALKLDVSNAPATATFSDISPGHYAFPYVDAVVKAGLIKGQGNGIFGNGQSLSRQDMAVIFVRALGVDVAGKAADLKFSDAASIADYVKDSVAAAVELWLLVGNNNGTFNPTGNATREQGAAVASKFLKEVQNNPKPSEEPTTNEPTPTVPTQPTTPTPSTGGSSGGGGSYKDCTAPTIIFVSTPPILFYFALYREKRGFLSGKRKFYRRL